MRLITQFVGLCAFLVLVQAGPLSAVEPAKAVLIELQAGQHLNVRFFDAARGLRLGPDSEAMVVWSEQQTDRWQYVGSNTQWIPSGDTGSSGAAQLFAQSRSTGSAGGETAGLAMSTTQLDQLLGTTVFRGRQGFLTPAGGPLLNPKFTIRREPQSVGDPYPLGEAFLSRGNREILRIVLPQNVATVPYEQMTNLFTALPDGLPDGEYSLRLGGTADSARFTIEDREWAELLAAETDRLAQLLNSRTEPLYLQVAVESLLDVQDEDGKPLPYLCDALDLLESIPASERTSYLNTLHRRILDSLQGNSERIAETKLISTGIPEIDRVRMHIAAGQWKVATAILDEKIPREPRALSLAQLHRAIILAQSGSGLSSRADSLFRQALKELKGGRESDLYLAHINAGNFLLGQAQDQLHNHAFQMAAGVRDPLLQTMTAWIHADSVLNKALTYSASLDVNEQAAARVSLARLQVLLADILRTLDVVQPGGERAFQPAEQAAVRNALAMAGEVTAGSGVNTQLLAAAQEIQAHLAYRQKSPDCVPQALKALELYTDAGSLTGVEGIHRLLGMYFRRSHEFEPGSEVDSEVHATDALRHFLISLELADLLRARIPADQFGLAHAGFFARRAYVNEEVIELLIGQGNPAEALKYAEQAKARSLQELLVTNHGTAAADEQEQERTISDLLGEWPSGTAAIEYFLGTEKAWLFLVNTTGEVRAWDLLGERGTSRDLVAELRAFLNGIEGQAVRMRQRLMSGKGFDHNWQDELSQFRQTLLPDEALTALREANSVVVVPHHILHYFPFAALVTQRDERPRSKMQMVQPRFLIDEDFDLVHAPSLMVWDRIRGVSTTHISQVNAVGIVDFPGAPRLPGVEQDLTNLRAAFGNRVHEILFAREATETNALKLLGQPGLILFATHGSNEPDRPLDSYLMCIGDQSSDGKLTAAELFVNDIQADMIVLSACYSGLADKSPLPGDDLFGIQRAFLQSGARTVMSGLWDVYDGTGPELMQEFFNSLARGIPAARALADSQRTFLEKRRASAGDPWLHPYFWAVYTLAGDGETHMHDPLLSKEESQ